MAARRRWAGILGGVLVVLLVPASPAFAPCHSIVFANDPYTVGESAGKVTITVSNGGGKGTPTVDYDTVNGTAKAGSDYQKTDGTVEFVLGESQAAFDVPITNDTADEPNEQFTVRLKNPSAGGCDPAPIIDEDTATVTIQDNDEKPIAQPTPTPTPTPTKASPKPKPSTASASPSPTPTSPSPTTSTSPIAVADSGDGGVSGGAIAGIVAATVVLGGAAAFWVRRRFLI